MMMLICCKSEVNCIVTKGYFNYFSTMVMSIHVFTTAVFHDISTNLLFCVTIEDDTTDGTAVRRNVDT